MLYPFLRWLVSAFALLLTAYIVPGFKVKNFSSALFAALLIGLANIMIRPALVFLTFPIHVLTFGLFNFVINAIILKICAAVLKGFEITSWTAALVGAVLLAIIGTGLHILLV